MDRIAETVGAVGAPVLGRLDIPVVIAAFNTRIAATAGRTEPALEHGRVNTTVDNSAPERAVADARRMIAFYFTVKTYDPFVAHHGWEGPASQSRKAFRAGARTRLPPPSPSPTRC